MNDKKGRGGGERRASSRHMDTQTAESHRFPLFKFFFQMRLQLGKSAAKPFSAPPAPQLTIKIPFPARMPPPIIGRQREILQWDEKPGVIAVVMFPMAHGRAVKIPRDDMHVQMRHGRHRMDPAQNLR